MALMICADGELEDGEVELAIQFLEADDAITDKAAALEALTENLEHLRAEYEKSKPLFKLKCSKMIAQVRTEITGPARDHAVVILEELANVARRDTANDEVLKKLTAALSD